MKIECKNCKQIVDVSPYFYNIHISTHDDFDTFGPYYKAYVEGTVICPHCGCKIVELFSSEISHEDIIKLALGDRYGSRN